MRIKLHARDFFPVFAAQQLRMKFYAIIVTNTEKHTNIKDS